MLTLIQIKSFLSISQSESSKDNLLKGFIADAVSELNSLCNRRLDWSEQTEILSGSGGTTLVLENYPVSKVSSIEILKGTWENLFTPPDTFDTSAILLREIGIIKLLKSYLFPKGESNIRVSYGAGYKGADDWAPNVNYAIGDYSRYNDAIYKCITAHTSGTTFDSSKWEPDSAKAVPESLAKALKHLAAKQFYESPAGKNLFMKSSESISSKQTDFKDIDISAIVHSFRSTNV
ncbi:MAG TPA: carbohydrate-binding protein [Ignavibacteria bacterium]|jgi:hypothetical protein